MINRKGLLTSLLSLGLALGWSGCGTNNVHETVFVCDSDTIRTGETVKIGFHDLPPNDTTLGGGDKDFPVRSDGAINMPLIGSVKAAGKKYGELEAELQKMYVPKYYRQLTLVIKPGDRFYSVDGEVKSPTRQLYLGETTVLRAIASCGGFNEFANRRKVKIIRANGQTEVVDCRKAQEDPKRDRPLCPGDHIVVPRSL